MKFNLWVFFIGASFISSELLCTVVGFDRLYNPRSKTVIDILHDSHDILVDLCPEDFLGPLSIIESRLRQSELLVLRGLRKLNQDTPGRVDVIWEHGYDKETGAESRVFIGLSKRLVRVPYPKLNFIASDKNRALLEVLFKEIPAERRYVTSEKNGVSIDKPLLPISREKKEAIILNTGEEGWAAFEKLYHATSQELKDGFTDPYMRGEDFRRPLAKNYPAFCAITDIEMLSNILASTKPHVIVYAGFWHSRNIVRFLRDRGFISIFSKPNAGRGPFWDIKNLALFENGIIDSGSKASVNSFEGEADDYIYGRSLLDAVRYGELYIARKCLEHGARTDMQDHNGLTALDLAEKRKYTSIITLLRKHNARGGLSKN